MDLVEVNRRNNKMSKVYLTATLPRSAAGRIANQGILARHFQFTIYYFRLTIGVEIAAVAALLRNGISHETIDFRYAYLFCHFVQFLDVFGKCAKDFFIGWYYGRLKAESK